MTADFLGLMTISLTLSAHLIATAWWAASMTKRVDYIEKWITSHEHTAARLVALEQQIAGMNSGISRIESMLRQRG
jgi:hypothetical protein